MAEKDFELRLEDTVAFMLELAGAQGELPAAKVLRWLPADDDARKALSKSLSVGHWYSSGNETEKKLRKARRAVLLAHAFFGANVERIKPAVVALGIEQLRMRFLQLFAEDDPPPRRFQAVFSSSFLNFADDQERAFCSAACDEVPARLAGTLEALQQVRSDPAGRRLFERWFGAFSDTKLRTVLMHFHTMNRCGKNIRLYYRGARIDAESTEIVPPGVDAASISHQRSLDTAGYHLHSDARAADPANVHIFIGEAMFGPLVRPRGEAGRAVSRAVVMIHELTHYLCNTVDQAYGSGPCLQRAAAGTDVMRNASSYQWYCEEAS